MLLGETSCAEDHKGSREVAGWTLPRIQGTKKGPGKFGSDSSSLLQIPWFVFTAHLPFPLPFRGHRTHDSGVCIRGLSSSHSHACQLLLTTTAHSFYEHRDLVLLSPDPGAPLLCPDLPILDLLGFFQAACLSVLLGSYYTTSYHSSCFGLSMHEGLYSSSDGTEPNGVHWVHLGKKIVA